MKNSHNILLGLVSLIALAGCMSERDIPKPNYDGLVFKASTEGVKTTLLDEENNHQKVVWKGGDLINVNSVVFGTEDNNATMALFGKIGDVQDPNPLGGYYYGYYPAHIYNNGTPSLPAIQTYDTSNAGSYLPMFAKSSTTSLQFKNLCGVLKIKAKSPGLTMDRIAVTSDQYMYGDFALSDTDDPYKAVIIDNEHAGHTVTLVCGSGGVSLDDYQYFYIAIPAGTHENLVIDFYTKDNQMCTAQTTASAKSGMTIARNTIYPVNFNNTLPFHPIVEYFTTYYMDDGSTVFDPEEGVNTGFSVTVQQPNFDQFKIAFCDANHNQINWDAGDVFEAKITAEVGGNYCFSCGAGEYSDAGDVFGLYADNSATWWKVAQKFTGGAEHNCATSNGMTGAGSTCYVRISKAGGFEFSFDGENYKTAIDPDDTDLMPMILNRGRSVPFYAGEYIGWNIVTYEYMKVTRNVAIPVTGITLNRDNLNLFVSQYDRLEETVLPLDAPAKDVIWASSDETIAEVDQHGKVTGIKAGTATITCTTVSGGFSASCNVTVASQSNVKFFNGSGQLTDEMYSFDGSLPGQSQGASFAIPTVNWDDGDYIEIKMSVGENGYPWILGNEGSTPYPNFPDRYAVYFTPTNTMIRFRCNNGTNNEPIEMISVPKEQRLETITLRVSKDKVEYLLDDTGDFIDVTNGTPLMFQDPTYAPVLYLGSAGPNTDTHYYYAKLVRGGDSPVAVTGINLNKSSVTLGTGATETLTAQFTPSNATNKTIIWSSSNDAIATVDGNGEITAVAEGTAVIRATAVGGTNIYDECTVHVSSSAVPVTGVSLNKSTTTIAVGDTETLTATITPSDATTQTVSWSSSDTSVATVNSSGVVTAVAPGTATITVTTTDGGHTDTCTVTVLGGDIYLNKAGQQFTTAQAFTVGANDTPSDFKFALPNINWAAGDYIEFHMDAGVETGLKLAIGAQPDGAVVSFYETTHNMNIYPGNWSSITGFYTYDLPVTYHLSKDGLKYKIDGKGWSSLYPEAYTQIQGVSNLYAGLLGGNLGNNQNHAASFTYFKIGRGNETPVAVTGVSLNKSTTSIEVGSNETLTATVSPSDASNKNVTWSSDATSVATVNSSGVVTAVSAGTAHITATTVDGGFTASCTVTVTNPAPVAVTGVSLNKATTSLSIGSTETLTATVAPSNASNKNVTWSSDATSVATVNSSGVITAVAVGTAHVTATTVDGGFTASCTVTVTEPTPEVILWQNYLVPATVQTKELEIISSGTPTDNQICFNNGDYIEIKYHRNDLASTDKDMFHMGHQPNVAPYIHLTGHHSGYTDIYYVPGGWTRVANVQQGVGVPLYVRFGRNADGTKGPGSYSLDGVNWTAYPYAAETAESIWNSVSTSSPLYLKTARSDGFLSNITYDYVKIVRGTE